MNPLQTLRDLDPRRTLRIAVGIWVLFALIIGGVVAAKPDRHTVTPEYRLASQKWWEAKGSLYDMSQIGYLYLPQAAILYTPYQVLPKRIGEPIWRWTGIALLATGLWRVAGLMTAWKREQLFLVATLLVLPASCASAQDGQVNLPLAGFMLLSVAELARTRWNPATIWLLLAVMLKPIAVAPALLTGACFRPLRFRLAAGFLLCLAVAYIHPVSAYVTAEYHHFWVKFLLAGQPLIKDNFSDFFGMLWHWGIHPAPTVIMAIRAAAALVTLLLALRLMNRFRGNALMQSFGVLLMAALYLMLFNPRTEENSFVILAGFTSLLAARDFVNYEPRWKWLALFCLLLAVDAYGHPIFPLTRIWFKPLVTSLFCMILVGQNFSLLQPAPNGDRGNPHI